MPRTPLYMSADVSTALAVLHTHASHANATAAGSCVLWLMSQLTGQRVPPRLHRPCQPAKCACPYRSEARNVFQPFGHILRAYGLKALAVLLPRRGNDPFGLLCRTESQLVRRPHQLDRPNLTRHLGSPRPTRIVPLLCDKHKLKRPETILYMHPVTNTYDPI